MKNICIISGIFLISAILNIWPYGFYSLLRWVVCIISLYVAYNFYKSKLNGWTLTFAALAFIFNPIIPVYLNKSNWVPIDLIGAILFFMAAFSKKGDKK